MRNILDETLKRCPLCKQTKGIDNFYRNRSRYDGLSSICKQCECVRQAKSYQKHAKKKMQGNKNYKKRIKFLVLGVYSNNDFSCSCCDEKTIDFLSIDHIDGGGNKHRKQLNLNGGSAFYRWLYRNDFPPGFQVLCMNCNWAKGKCGVCPHEQKLFS